MRVLQGCLPKVLPREHNLLCEGRGMVRAENGFGCFMLKYDMNNSIGNLNFKT